MRHPALAGGGRNGGTRRCDSSERWLLLLVGAVASLQAGCAAAEPTGPIVTTENGVSIVESAAPQWGDDGGWAISVEPTLEIGVESGAPEYMLAGVRAAISLDDGRIALANAVHRVQQVFKLSRLDRMFPVCSNVMAAMAAVESTDGPQP